MYINFWYAMEESKNVTAEKPAHVKRLNQDFVLWRDDQGQVHCLHDVCSHRGARLSKGVIRNNCVQCPYHGWQFQGSGDCAYVPSLGKHNQKFPQRTRIDSYPVQEAYGVIFAFLGDLPESERPPLLLPNQNPKNMDYSGKQWRHATLGWDIKSNYERCVENGLDPSHNEFVHPTHGFKGENLDEYYVPEYDVERHEWGQSFLVDFNAPPPTHEVAKQSGRTEAARIKAGAGHSGPNQVWTYIYITPEMWAHQYLYETPVDSKNTHAINVSLVNFVDENTSDDDINAMNAYIAEQDVVVLNEIMPITTPDETSTEVMMPSDKCVLEYRRYLRRWEARGWRIDAKKVEAEYGEKVYAIPSPRRRTEKSWVFPPVPLLPGKDGGDL